MRTVWCSIPTDSHHLREQSNGVSNGFDEQATNECTPMLSRQTYTIKMRFITVQADNSLVIRKAENSRK